MRRRRVDTMTVRELRSERKELLVVVRAEQSQGRLRSPNYRRLLQVTGEMAYRTFNAANRQGWKCSAPTRSA